ncbi:cyanophycinase [Caloramator sp. ALD01]|uniref:cyanophycinase n=1 Tax=Caloramator sp. ALD01 TaxID=1031288 RepID=UPI000412CCAD|nr:cyanophycinase [Caloramator sp. ALD01]
MKKRLILFTSLLIVSILFSTITLSKSNNLTQNSGSLVIVGGALESSNGDIYRKFIELSGGKKAVIGIIGAASTKPYKYSNDFKNDLIKYGVKKRNIYIIPIAVRDDKTTPNVDESKWAQNVNNPEVIKMIDKCTGIWFVGGDQTRITGVLYNKDGSNTPALDAIWSLYNRGGVIGGTSAGAAVMSNPMIAGGNSFGALKYGFTDKYEDYNDQEQGPVYATRGLGFFNQGIIDQHFDRKARLGRLIVTLLANKEKFNLGFGIDENTALIYYSGKNEIEAVGRGGIVILDVENAYKEDNGAIKNVDISYIEKGDKYNINNRKFMINTLKETTRGYEYYEIEGPIINSGILSPNASLRNLLSFDLMDNYCVDEVKSYSFDTNGDGFELIFKKGEKSQGYWAYLDGNSDSYSVTNVILDIIPVKITITHK